MLHMLSVLMGSVRGGIRERNPHQMSTKPHGITETDWTEHARQLKDLTHSSEMIFTKFMILPKVYNYQKNRKTEKIIQINYIYFKILP